MQSIYAANSELERQRIREELLGQFSWPIEEEFMASDFLVETVHRECKHVVYWPREISGKSPTFGRYLHEMGHALLAERYHPQFGKPYFVKETDMMTLQIYQSLFDATLDWFVEALLMRFAPAPQGRDIDKRYHRTMQLLGRGLNLPNLNFVIDSGLSLASFTRYREAVDVPQGMIEQVFNAFSRAKPDTPSLFNLQGLVTSLLRVFGQHEAKLVCERGFEHWQIKTLKSFDKGFEI